MQAAIAFGFFLDDLEQLASAALPTSDSPYAIKKTVSFSSSTSRGGRDVGLADAASCLVVELPCLVGSGLSAAPLPGAMSFAEERSAAPAPGSAAGDAAGCELEPQAAVSSQ